MLINYSLSLWIANLGVVPLFSLAFLRFLPALFALSFLLLRVCIVLEPIYLSLSYRFNSYFKQRFLSFTGRVVKIFILAIASQHAIAAEEIFLSKGEQAQLKLTKLNTYSVGNTEVIKTKYLAKDGILLIKGKSLGFSDIVIWEQKDKKAIYHIYVTSKRSQLKRMQILTALKGTHIQTLIAGNLIILKGEIVNSNEYFIIQNMLKNKHPNMTFDLNLDHSFRNIIISQIYRQLYDQGVDFVKCSFTELLLNCEYADPQNNADLSSLTKKWNIKWKRVNKKNLLLNYKLNFKLVSLEYKDLNQASSGLDKIEFELATALSKNRANLSSSNFLLQRNNYHAYLVSTPQVITILNESFHLELGSEIPFTTQSEQNSTTTWKFAGIKLSGQLKQKSENILLKLKSEITSPDQQNITGPKGATSLYLNLNKYQKVFSIDIDTKSNQIQAIPYLSQIPILGDLFSTKSTNFQHKKIYCFVEIIPED